MHRISKWLVLILLAPTIALAGFYDEEEGDPGVVPSDPGAITGVIQGGLGSADKASSRVVIDNGNGDVHVVIDVNGGKPNSPTNTPNLISTSTSTPGNFGVDNNLQSILAGLNTKLKTGSTTVSEFTAINGFYDLRVPTLQKNVIVEKTVALGTPTALYVSKTAFTPGSDTITPTGIKFFKDVTVLHGDLAVVIGETAKARAVATQLVANGIHSDQIIAVPDVRLDDSNTVAVYVIRLPMMQDLFKPANTASN